MSPGRALQQIGPPNVAYKNKISGQRADGLRTALEIGNKKSQMLWSVAGSMCGAQPDLAERDVRSVLQRLRVLQSLARVSPILRALGG